jgi:hypothetical protein
MIATPILASGDSVSIDTTAADVLTATDGTTLYMGRLAWADYPATGPAEDAPSWTIYRITTDAAGNVSSEQSAVGAWSNKANLIYS